MEQFKTQCYVMLETTRKESGKENYLSSFWQMTATMPPSRGQKARTGLLGVAKRTGAGTPQRRASPWADGAEGAWGPCAGAPPTPLPKNTGLPRIARRKIAQARGENRSTGRTRPAAANSLLPPATSVKRKEALRRSEENLQPRFLPSVPLAMCKTSATSSPWFTCHFPLTRQA